METFFGLLVGNSLTRLVFFPTIAALPLFFFARAQSRAAKIYVLVASLIELRLRGPVPPDPPGRGRQLPAGARQRAPLDPELRHPVRPGDGRHLDAAGAARHPPRADRDPRLLEGDREALAAVRRLDAAAHHRRARHPAGLRPLPVLHLLGGDADPDVPADRHLGGRAADLRGGQVLPLHHGREPADADRHPLDGLDLPEPERRRLELRLHRPAAARPAGPPADLAVRRLRADLRHQGADVPGAHLAAGRPRRGAHGRLGDPRRHPAEARHLRLPALRHPALPARQRGGPAAAAGPRDRRHPLRRAGRLGADGHEEAGRLLLDRPPRVRDARHARLRHRRLAGLAPPDGQPRPVDRRPLPPRRHALRPAAHQEVRRVRRPRQGDAGVRLLPGLRQPGVGGPARPQRLRGRVHDPDRQLPHPGLGAGRARHLRRGARRDLPAQDDPAHHLGPDHQGGEPEAGRPLRPRAGGADPALHLHALDRRRARWLPAAEPQGARRGARRLPRAGRRAGSGAGDAAAAGRSHRHGAAQVSSTTTEAGQ